MSAPETDRQVHVLQLYPRDMNIYGDFGNALVIRRRLEWLGYEPVLHSYDPGDEFPGQVDIVVGGGGQDSGQDIITPICSSRETGCGRWWRTGSRC